MQPSDSSRQGAPQVTRLSSGQKARHAPASDQPPQHSRWSAGSRTAHEISCERKTSAANTPDFLLDVQRAYHQRLLAHAGRLVSCPEDAEDLVQDLYSRMPDLIPEEGSVKNLLAYLRGCLRRLARNVRTRETKRFQLLSVHASEHTAPSWSVPTDELDAHLTCEEILNRLPAPEAELLRMKYLEDKPGKEVAAHLGISEAAARFRLHCALENARRARRQARPPDRGGT